MTRQCVVKILYICEERKKGIPDSTATTILPSSNSEKEKKLFIDFSIPK